ncbi:hypothetical protein ACLOJK_013220 [Asimina triloba]
MTYSASSASAREPAVVAPGSSRLPAAARKNLLDPAHSSRPPPPARNQSASHPASPARLRPPSASGTTGEGELPSRSLPEVVALPKLLGATINGRMMSGIKRFGVAATAVGMTIYAVGDAWKNRALSMLGVESARASTGDGGDDAWPATEEMQRTLPHRSSLCFIADRHATSSARCRHFGWLGSSLRQSMEVTTGRQPWLPSFGASNGSDGAPYFDAPMVYKLSCTFSH